MCIYPQSILFVSTRLSVYIFFYFSSLDLLLFTLLSTHTYRLLMSSLFYANRIYCDTIYLKVCLKDIYVQKCVLNVFQTNSVMCMCCRTDSHSRFWIHFFPDSLFSLFLSPLDFVNGNACFFSVYGHIRAQAEEQQWTSVVLSLGVSVGFFFIFCVRSSAVAFFSPSDTRYLWIGCIHAIEEYHPVPNNNEMRI